MSWHGWLSYNTVILILCVCANIIYFLSSKFNLVCLWIVNVQIIFECVSCLNTIWVLFIFNAWHLYSFYLCSSLFADTCTHSVPIFLFWEQFELGRVSPMPKAHHTWFAMSACVSPPYLITALIELSGMQSFLV